MSESSTSTSNIVTNANPVSKQSSEEWLRNHAGNLKTIEDDLYEFVTWSTRRDGHDKGRLVLIFRSLANEKTFPWFCNIQITQQRGPKKGAFYETGHRGRFWALPASKFTQLWRQVVREPGSLSTIYRRMGNLKGLRYRARIRQKPKYTELVDIEVVRN